MSSMQGHYSDTGLPLLQIPTHVSDERFIEIEVILDSGFNRGLLIYEPDARAAKLPPRRRFDHMVYVADGREWPAKITTAYVKWFDELREVEVLVVEPDACVAQRSRKQPERGLVGMEFLRGTEMLLGASTVRLSPEGD